MYQLENAICLRRSVGSQWEFQDLSAAFVYACYQEFKQFYLILSHPSLPGEEIYVDMNEVRKEFYNFVGTVPQWLVSIGDRALPHSPTIPNEKIKYVKYANATQTGYEVRLAQAGLHYPNNYPTGSLLDLRLNRARYKTDMSLVNDSCLVTVNGYIHDTTGTTDECFVLNGGITGRVSRETNVGIISFLDVSKLHKVKLSKEKIVPMEQNSTLYEKIRFSVDEDLEGKSYFLVLGGYLVFPEENTFYQIGENTFSLNLQRLHYEERIFESQYQIDLASLNIQHPNHSPSGIDLTALRSDETIRAYMTLSQSFLVIMDIPRFEINRSVVQRAAFPGQFMLPEEPVYPLLGKYGKILDYWKIQEGDQWSLNCSDTFYKTYVYTEGPRERAKFASDALDTTRRYQHTQAYILEITGFKE